LAFTTLPTHAMSLGQVRREQSGPVHSASPSAPVWHKQLRFFSQLPWPLQKFSHIPLLLVRRNPSVTTCPHASRT